MPTISRPGALLNYEVWGEAGTLGDHWVTLVNGHTRPLNDFRLMGRHLAEHGYKILALDNRGAGKTETSAPFTLADMAGDVVALWDHVGAKTSDLLGVSMGGFIATTVAADQAKRVRRLVLVSTAVNQTRIRRDDTPWSTDLAEVERKLSPYFTADFAKRNDVLVKSMVKQIAKAGDSGRFQAASEQQKHAVAGYDGTAKAKTITAPTLIIHGDQDAIVPQIAAEELRAAIPASSLEVFRGAGHLLLAEKPRDLYALVEGWFSR